MSWKRASACVLALSLWCAPSGAFDIDRTTVKLRYVELPSVAVVGLDYSSLRAEIAYGEVELGEPVLKTTQSYCVPDKEDLKLKDVMELPTHYYEVPYRTRGGVMVVRDGSDRVIHAARIDALVSHERFGYDKCQYVFPQPLETDFQAGYQSFVALVEENARGYFLRSAGQVLDDALFFNVVVEKVPIYTFKDKKRDYADLNTAAGLAKSGYAALERSVAGLASDGREELERAVDIWEQALAESDLNDKTARINKKVTVKLHESVGVALLALGEPDRAVLHLDKAKRYALVVTSRSSGTGTADLLERARRRKGRSGRNAELQPASVDLETLMRETDAYRGQVPIVVLYAHEQTRLEAEHNEFVVGAVVGGVKEEVAEREAAIAAGEENRYERMVGQSAMQGFFLFLMPYPEKLEAFPSEVCDLTHLNRLRVPNHTFDSVPEEIGNLKSLEILDLSGNRLRELPGTIAGLTSLKKLDLSGNRLESLPEAIGELKNLKVLQLKGNPLAPGEADRLKRLLPRCKIKA